MEEREKSDIAGLRRALAEWFCRNRRELPWRAKPGLYATVVSELMAQQTRIATMLPYYARWMERFPDFVALAAAEEAEVLRHWEGLGYYSRARNLHHLAKAYLALPEKPQTAREWESLPGIGPYTAAAIASLVFGEKVAVVDGNVVRILSRLFADARAFSSGSAAAKAFAPRAAALLDPEAPGRHNEAMMELGALVCVKGTPRCGECPLFPYCRAAREGGAEALPVLERRAVERLTLSRVFALRGGALLLQRIPEGARRLAGQCELPKAEALAFVPAGEPLAVRTRTITHHHITERIFALPEAAALPEPLPPELVLVPLAELSRVTLSGPHRRWITELVAARGGFPGTDDE